MEKHLHAGLLPILILTGSLLAQTVVPITGEPDHHLVISNNYVRVFKVEVPPKAETLYHQHDYDYLYVAIGDADVTSTRLHEKPVEVKLKDGEVELSKAPFAHQATNNSDQPFRNVTIEVLDGAGDSLCGASPGEGGCGLFTCIGLVCEGRVFRTTKLSVTLVTFRGKSIGSFSSCPCLLVALTESKLSLLSQNSTQEISAKAGDAVWIGQSDAKLGNLAGPIRFLLVSVSSAKMQ